MGKVGGSRMTSARVIGRLGGSRIVLGLLGHSDVTAATYKNRLSSKMDERDRILLCIRP